MFFTQEDYRKIEKWLTAKSRKDTDFVGAATPLKGNETVVLVQDGKNVKTSVKDIVDQFFLLGVSDFLNITDKYGESYISLAQAIQLIPFRSRKEGQVITFLNTEGNWEIYQFIGKLNQWNIPTLWNNPFDPASAPTTGKFNDKPLASTGIKVGFQYYCTDRLTTEGASYGIMIYHKGNNVWIDALGRVVS